MISTHTARPDRAPVATRWLAVATLCIAATAPVAALSLTVDCDGGPADHGTLQDAVNALAPAGFHTITVTGTCVESVTVSGFENLTIAAPAATTAIVESAGGLGAFAVFDSTSLTLSGLAIDAAGDDFGVITFGSRVDIRRSSLVGAADTALVAFESEVSLGSPVVVGDGVSIHDNEYGAFASDSTLNLNGQVTIEDNVQDALIFSNADGGGIARDLGNAIRNNGFGIAILDGERIRFSGLHTIENNGPYGLFILRPDRVAFTTYPGSSAGPPFFGTTISGHAVWGVLAVSTVLDFLGPSDFLVHEVSGNGAAPLDNDAGIWIGRQAEGRLRNLTVDGNTGPGIKGAVGAYVNLLNVAVTNNTGDGMLLADNSTGDLGSFFVTDGTPVPPNATFSGNGGKNIRCVNDSVLAGNTTGISQVQCGGGGGGGGGRPLAEARAGGPRGFDPEARLESHRQRLEELARLRSAH